MSLADADGANEDPRDDQQPMSGRSQGLPFSRCPACSHEFTRRERRAFHSPLGLRRRQVPCPGCAVLLTYARGPWRRQIFSFGVFFAVSAVILPAMIQDLIGDVPSGIEDRPEGWILLVLFTASAAVLIHALLTLKVVRA